MNDLSNITKPLLKATYVWLAMCLVSWLVFPAFRPYAAGLILGSVTSWVNTQFLVMKIRQLSNMVLEKKTRRASLGFISRICFALIAAMTALRFPDIDLLTTLIGFFFCPIAAFFVGIALLRKDKLSQ
mgnify:CR=1 FL=1